MPVSLDLFTDSTMVNHHQTEYFFTLSKNANPSIFLFFYLRYLFIYLFVKIIIYSSLRIQVCPFRKKSTTLSNAYFFRMGLEPKISYSIGRGLDS